MRENIRLQARHVIRTASGYEIAGNHGSAIELEKVFFFWKEFVGCSTQADQVSRK